MNALWGVAISLVGRALGVVFGAATAVLLARHFGPETFGVWSFGVVTGSFVVMALEGGLNRMLMREAARSPERAADVLSAALRWRWMLLLVNIPLAVCGYLFVDDGTVLIVALLVAARQSEMIQGTYLSLAVVLDKHLAANAIEVVKKGVILAAALVLIATGKTIVWVAGAFLLLCVMGWGASGVYMSRLAADRRTGQRFGLSLRDSFLFWLSGLLYWVHGEVDQLMLGSLHSSVELGHYAAGVRLTALFGVVPIALSKVVVPRLFRLVRASSESRGARGVFGESTLFMSAVGGLAAVELWAHAEFIVTLLFGNAYASSVPVLQVMSLFLCIDFIRTPASWAIAAQDRLRYSVAITLMASILNIGLNIWAIPRYGAVGAATSTVTSGALLLALAWAPVLQTWGFRALRHAFLGAALPSIALLLHAFATGWLDYFVSAVVFGAALMIAFRRLEKFRSELRGQ